MKNIFLFIALFLFTSQGSAQIRQPKSILFIGAHPDDETALGEALVKYARLGNKVQVMIATDGKSGTRVTKIPEGDSLGNLRKLETTCACSKMGIEPPIFLSIERLDTRIGVGNYFKCHQQLLDSLRSRILTINPDVIISFGPDGDTHHSEHIVIGAAVTELLLMEEWVDKYPLYYLAWTKEQGQQDELGYVSDQYFNVRVQYSQEDENNVLEAMPCYETQYTAEEIKKDRQMKLKNNTNTLFFRRFSVTNGLKNDF